MGWLVEIIRHLDREASARREPIHKSPEQPFMIADPLEDCVREQDVPGSGLVPLLDAAQLELHGGKPLLRRLDHLRRIVDADNAGVGIMRDEQFRGVAGTASEVCGG